MAEPKPTRLSRFAAIWRGSPQPRRVDLSDPLVREPLSSRSRLSKAAAGTGGNSRQGVVSPHDLRIKFARCRGHVRTSTDGARRRAAQPGVTRWAGKPAPGSSTALPTFFRGREELSRCASAGVKL